MNEIDQSGSKSTAPDYIDATEACSLLGVKLATLYAYTSRGLVKSVPGPRGRARLYLRTDIERLRVRGAQNSTIPAIHNTRTDLLIETSITHLGVMGSVYRGKLATELALTSHAFESVAELLWTGSLPDDAQAVRRWRTDKLGLPAGRLARLLPDRDGRETAIPVTTLQLVLSVLAARDDDRFAPSLPAVLDRARSVIARLAATIGLPLDPDAAENALDGASMAEVVLRSLGRRAEREACKAIDTVLVLCADTEMDPATLSARVAASVGADVYNVLGAALAVFTSSEAGSECDRIEVLVDSMDRSGSIARTVRDRLRRSEGLSGFGSHGFPSGDPRANVLLQTARTLEARGRTMRTIEGLTTVAAEAGVGGPSLELGVFAVCAALDLPSGSATTLIALARCAGWVAHGLEQRTRDEVIRAHARSVTAMEADGTTTRRS